MLSKSLIESVLTAALAGGGDLSELFFEDTRRNSLEYRDSKVQTVLSGRDYGAGIRVLNGLNYVYAYTADVSEAGLMAAAIISDTVMFKSPTCTKRDKAMAERLARIANISLKELGKELFSASGAEDRSTEELFMSDYKQFHIAEKDIGVSQITCIDSARLLDRRDEFMETMNSLRSKYGFDIIILMITDVLLEGSHLLYAGSDDIIQQAFNVQPKDNHIFLPKVMSRKKQIIPMLTALWG